MKLVQETRGFLQTIAISRFVWWVTCISDEIVVEFVPFFLADNKFGETDESRREDSSKLNAKDTSHPWSV